MKVTNQIIEIANEQEIIERLNNNQVSDAERQYWVETFARQDEQKIQRMNEKLKELSDQVDAYEAHHAEDIRQLKNKFANIN